MLARSLSTTAIWGTHLLLGIAAAIGVLSLGDAQPVALSIALGLVALSAVLAYLSQRHVKSQLDSAFVTPHTPQKFNTAVRAAENLQISALPLLAEQIDIANLYMEEETIFLTSGFYGLIHQSGRLAEFLDEETGATTIDFRQECDILRREINKVMVVLQFQDRVSQVLAHVSQDLRKIQQLLEDNRKLSSEGKPVNHIDIEKWLSDLKQSYTMTQQMVVHHGGNKPMGKLSRDTSVDSEVTFF